MGDYAVPLRKRYEVAEATLAFAFEKPAAFSFQPGQYLTLTLPDLGENDEKGLTRMFSIASAPRDEELLIAVRIRDTAFKRTLRRMPIGTAVLISGPYGFLTLPRDASLPAVFLSGGIGIAPFRSMLRHVAHTGTPYAISLLSSNRRPEDAPFFDELTSFSFLKFVPTMTQAERSRASWEGERGYIDAEMLARHIPDIRTPVYSIVGPPAFVASMQILLFSLGVSGERIHIEEFSGY